MANRSYLYSTNIRPGPGAVERGRKFIGISEWGYDIPLVFKLLLSGNPETCLSSIWDSHEEIALIGDSDLGIENIEKFLSMISYAPAQPLVTEALEFLKNPKNRNQYFVLECGEIFVMDDTPFMERNLELLEQIKDLQPEIDIALQLMISPVVAEPIPVGFFARLLGRAAASPPAPDPMRPFYALGLGNWSNILYFDFSAEESDKALKKKENSIG